MSMRVTSGMMVDRVLNNLNRQTTKILSLQNQLSTGLRVNAPSDDPIATRLAIDTRTAIQKSEQYLGNISAASPWLAETASAIETASEYLGRVYELTLQGANGTYDQSQLDNIATEINELLEGFVSTANYNSNGRYIFAGTRTMSPAFEITRNAAGEITAVTYQGTDKTIATAVGDGVTVNINEVGSKVFQGSQDIFQLIIDIRDNLRAGDKDTLQTANLTGIETGRLQLLQSQARVGSVQNRLDRVNSDTEDFIFEYKSMLSDTIDADYADTLISLNAQNNAYQAALNAAARVVQPSLMDFIS